MSSRASAVFRDVGHVTKMSSVVKSEADESGC